MIPGQLIMTFGRTNTGIATATVTGVAQKGQVLTCAFNNNDPDGAAISGPTFQWVRGASTDIGGATASTYTAAAADVGSTLKCRLVYTDAKGFVETITSNVTGAVADVTTGILSTFTTGSGSQTIPAYNTIQYECWGAAASGQSWKNNGGAPNVNGGSAGGASTIGPLTAGGGQPGITGAIATGAVTLIGGAAGTASGGSTNTSGTAGGNGLQQTAGSPVTSGAGGAGANGGAGGVGVSDPSNVATTQVTGNNGTAPGGAGSGGSNFTGGQNGHGAGGGGGAYSKIIYTLGVGAAPAVGAGVAWSVGTGGNAVAATGADTGCMGGNGTNGQARFTVLS